MSAKLIDVFNDLKIERDRVHVCMYARVRRVQSAPALMQSGPSVVYPHAWSHVYRCIRRPFSLGRDYLVSIGWLVRNVGTADGSSTIVRYAIKKSNRRRTGYVSPTYT